MKIVTLFLFFVYYSSFSLFFACDRTNLDVISLIQNPNGTYTYNFFICIETRPDFIYGDHTELIFSFPASGAKILGLTPGSIGFENGINWTISGLNTTSAKYSGAALNFVPSTSVVKHPTNPKFLQQCFNFSVTIDKDPNLGFNYTKPLYKVQIGANGGICIKESTNLITVMKNTPSYLPTNGLIGWWPFDGKSFDESGNGNHGTIIGPFSFNTDRNEKPNSALVIDSNTRIEVPSINCNNILKYSISSWFYKSSQNANTNNTLFTQSNGLAGANGIRLWIGEDNALSLAIEDEQNKYSVGIKVKDKNLSDNKWHHVVGVIDADSGFYNDSNFKIYVDGVLASSLIYSNEKRIVSPFVNNKNSTTFGNNRLNKNALRGIIDDIAIYNRVLTQEEITALYLGDCNGFTAIITPQGSTTVCQGTPVVLNANVGNDFSYVWKKNNTVISGATIASYSATTSGSYEVEIATSNGCKKSSAKTLVTVNPLPLEGKITGKNYLCKGESIQLVASIPGGVWSSLQPNLASVDQNGNVTGLMRTSRFTPEVVGYTLTNQLGCSATAKRGIGIDSLPVQPIIAGPNAICAEGTALFRVTNTAGVNWAAGPFITASSAYQGMFTHRKSSNGSVPNDNFETFVKATAYSLNKVCTSVTTRAVKLRLARSKSIIMSAPTSLLVNATTPVSVSFQSDLTVTPSSRFWISSATSDLTVVQTTATSTTVKALRIPTALPKLYYNAIETSTGCGMSAYKQFTVMAAASLVAANTTQTVITNGVHIYPNPSNGRFTIENSEEATEIKLVDITGRIIATHEITAGTTTVDFSGVTAGKYMVHITGESINEIQPIVIE